VVKVRKGGARFDIRPACIRIHSDGSHGGEIDHQPFVADRVPGYVVTATSDGYQQAVIAGKGDRAHHIRHTCAPHDQPGLAVDHRVPDRACGVKSRIAWQQNLTPHLRPEFLDFLMLNSNHREAPLSCRAQRQSSPAARNRSEEAVRRASLFTAPIRQA
jgi:hypothetical protein